MNPIEILDQDSLANSHRLELTLKLFRGLSDPTRLTILEVLRNGELRVIDLEKITGRTQSTVSTHLACLRDCGLIHARPAGRETFYSLADERMEDLLLMADDVVVRIANKVRDCRKYEVSE